jgi:PII-like signaling protein
VKEEFQARMIRVHFGENDKWQDKPLYEAIFAKSRELEIAEAMVYRGIEGFGPSTRIRHASHWIFSSDAPMQLSLIDSEEKIAQILPHLDAMVDEGLIAISTVAVTRYSHSSDRTPG